MKKIHLMALMLFGHFASWSQETVPAVASKPGFKKSVVLKLHAGTQGLGGDAQFMLSKALFMRGGASFLPIEYNDVKVINSDKVTSKISADFTNAHLWLGIKPFKGFGLMVVTGVGYFLNGSFKSTAMPKEVKYGDILLTAEEIGILSTDISWKNKIAPYAGISLFRAVPKHFFNINIDLGTYYLSSPEATVTGTKLLEGNSQLSVPLTQNMEGYKWLPILQLNLNFKL